jgi:HK97 family phage prohead protease
VDALTIPAAITAADPGGRTITGRVLLYGQVGHTSAGPARFAAGSLTAADPSRVKLLVEHDVERVVGFGASVVPDADGITATFSVPQGPEGDAVLASAAAGLRDGLSVGVELTDATRAADGVLDVTAAVWRETSIVAIPAYTGTQVTRVAASAQLVPAYAPGSRADAQPGHRVAPILTPVHQVTKLAARYTGDTELVSEACERMAAGWRQNGVSGLLDAALADIVLPTDPTQRDAMIPPQWVGELFQARLHGQRPIIDAIQKKPLTSIRVTGIRKTWPSLGVGDYAGGKAQIPSAGTMVLEPVSTDAQRIAGGHDVDRILFDFPADYGSGSWLQSYYEIQTDNYLALTESHVATALLADATTLPGTPADVLTAITDLAAYLGSVGASLDFLKVSPDLYGAALAIKNTDAPWLFTGSANITDQSATIGGLTIRAEATLPAGTVLGGDRRAATFFEWRNPPIRVQALEVARGGVDLAVYGYWAYLTNDAAAVAVTHVAPVLPFAADDQSRSKAAK